jgi:acyl carrier protein
MMELQDRLNQIFREVFNDDDISITPGMTANDVEGWDSLSHVNLIVAIETKFAIRFSQKELLTFKNVGDLLNSIRGKIST